MPENRFYLNAPLEKGAQVTLEGEELHHLKVMRRLVGDSVELVNGRNQLGYATLTSIEKRGAILTLAEVKESPPPQRKLILVQAYLRPKNLDLVIEKGTELGATSFWLFPGDRSEKKELSPSQLDRLHHLALSALKQSGRLDLPSILQKPPLQAWADPPKGILYFGDPTSSISLTSSEKDTYLFIGPEKGFASQEKELLSRHYLAQGIRLSPNILRAETAAICALAQSVYYS